jgi:methylsterol monooxygenase/4-alpha-methyl-delta7-sterol-4alpha-methyl oxidase
MMHSSLSSTGCSTPTNDSVHNVIKNDTIRYSRKGYGLISAFLLTLSFFYLVPQFFKMIWPVLLKNMSSNAIFFCFAIGLHSGVTLFSNIVMYVIYKIKLPFFERYRISEKPWPWEANPQLWNQILKKTLKCLSIAHFVIVPVILMIELNMGIKMRLDLESFPSAWEIITQIVFFMFCEDFFFYWSHRALHHPKIYPYIHKIHHEYNITVSLAAEYAHPLEFLVGNLFSTNSGPKILGSRVHFVTYCIWLIIRLMETTDGHCGYEFSWSPYRLLPLSGSSIYHNFHHSNNVGNYGSFFTIWDTLCGTNKHYFKYLANREKKQLSAKLAPEYNKMTEKNNASANAELAKQREENLEREKME